MQIRPLDRDEFDAAARLFADAFLDDPGWVAVGPDRAGHRHGVLRRYHRTALDVIQRYGGPIYGAFEDGGALTGVAATFAAGLYPPPAWTIAGSSPAFSLPAPGRSSEGSASQPSRRRGIRMTLTCICGFSPSTRSHQRGGVGRALLARVYGGRRRRPSISTRRIRPTFPTTRATGTRSSARPTGLAARRCGL